MGRRSPKSLQNENIRASVGLWKRDAEHQPQPLAIWRPNVLFFEGFTGLKLTGGDVLAGLA